MIDLVGDETTIRNFWERTFRLVKPYMALYTILSIMILMQNSSHLHGEAGTTANEKFQCIANTGTLKLM